MRITDTHVYFWSGVFSNFWPAKIDAMIDNAFIEFKTSEHLFMALKAEFFQDEEIFEKILYVDDPQDAKKLGREIKNYDDLKWTDVRYECMLHACHLKFEQNSDLKKILLDTGDRILVEASPYDKIWGVGLREDDDTILDSLKWRGQNLLGNVLMDVRERLK